MKEIKKENNESRDKVVPENPMKLLEDALVICKFGCFNFQVMLASLFSILATNSVSTDTSYILSSAECDLDMTLIQKGTLNGIPFLGQVCASFFTGFIIDAFGRKVFLAGGNIALFIAAVFGACSQTYYMLLIAKLIQGVIMSLVFSATATMISELTHKNVRDRIMMAYAGFMSTSIIVLALLAWAILPQALRFVVIDEYFVIHSWNLYLLLNACWSFLAACMYWYLPESPKFLLSHGKEKEALKILKRIYRTNTGKDENSFPMVSLNVPGSNGYKITENETFQKKITGALFEVKELFRPPLVFKLILFSSNIFVCLLLYSALRLWYPQLSTIIENYQREHGGHTDRFCIMLDSHLAANSAVNSSIRLKNITEPHCVPVLSGSDTYTNGMMLGFISLICISASGYLVKWWGQKPLMFIFFVLCAVCSAALYWISSSIIIAVLISSACGFLQAAFSLQQSILVRVFPTSVRTVAFSLVITMGRSGSLIGNIIFPMLLRLSCMVPFIMLSVATLGVAGLIYFFPNPHKENRITGDT